MTDLLEQLRHINPVARCDPPSIVDVWRKLDSRGRSSDGAGRRPAFAPRRSRMRVLPSLVAVGTSVAVLAIALTSLHSAPRTATATHRPGLGKAWAAWHASDGQSPSLSALMAHFALLRRPPTATDRAAVRRFGVGIGTSANRTEYPTFVRYVGKANGVPVYLVVFAVFKHGASGRVVSYTMDVDDSSGGNSYIAGNYSIFPYTDGDLTTSSGAYLSIVPDGVRSVRWQLGCPPGYGFGTCVRPDRKRAVTLTVHRNLAVLPLAQERPGTTWAAVVKVTWYGTDGTKKTFDNQNAAVPFKGAPPWPSR